MIEIYLIDNSQSSFSQVKVKLYKTIKKTMKKQDVCKFGDKFFKSKYKNCFYKKTKSYQIL